jgi:hypothetical protein
VLADISLETAQQAVADLDDPGKFSAEHVDASNVAQLVSLIARIKADIVVNACDPRFNESIFEACRESKCNYLDMAMNLSKPHPTHPYTEVGVALGHDQLAAHEEWKERGILALVGMGVEPGLSNVFARYASDHLFDEVHEIGVRDGSNLSIDGFDSGNFAEVKPLPPVGVLRFSFANGRKISSRFLANAIRSMSARFLLPNWLSIIQSNTDFRSINCIDLVLYGLLFRVQIS